MEKAYGEAGEGGDNDGDWADNLVGLTEFRQEPDKYLKQCCWCDGFSVMKPRDVVVEGTREILKGRG